MEIFLLKIANRSPILQPLVDHTQKQLTVDGKVYKSVQASWEVVLFQETVLHTPVATSYYF
jgi:hypothetical protein